MLQRAATSSSVWAITQPSMQWTQPERKSSQQACSNAEAIAIRQSVSAARVIRLCFSSRWSDANGVEPVCSRYCLPRALTATDGEYKLNNKDKLDDPSNDRKLTWLRNLLAANPATGNAITMPPINSDLRVHFVMLFSPRVLNDRPGEWPMQQLSEWDLHFPRLEILNYQR